jgi:hypothetical protein
MHRRRSESVLTTATSLDQSQVGIRPARAAADGGEKSSNPLFAPLFGPIPLGGKSKDWLESRGPV